VYPTADTIIRGSYFTNDNYGASHELLVKSGGDAGWRSVLRFSGLSSYMNAELYIYVTYVNTDALRTVTVSRYSGIDWDENTLSWNNFDPYKIDRVGETFEIRRSDAGKWKSVSVSDLLLKGGKHLEDVVLVLDVTSGHSERSDFAFGSRESGMSPRLLRGEECYPPSTNVDEEIPVFSTGTMVDIHTLGGDAHPPIIGGEDTHPPLQVETHTPITAGDDENPFFDLP